jgi:hypothetical protein
VRVVWTPEADRLTIIDYIADEDPGASTAGSAFQ